MATDTLGLVGHTDGQLRFDEIVAEGGFGLVYRGEHLGLREPVAIKCLKVHQLAGGVLGSSFEKRFSAETRIAYRLSQGNLDIVRSITSGTLVAPKTQQPVPYMVLEWLEGSSLAGEIKSRKLDGRPPWTLEEAAQFLDTAAVAVAFAHDEGIVHRDLKPGNLFVSKTRNGSRVKVLDFGLAKVLTPDMVEPQNMAETGSNVYLASPSYGAPEQFSRKLSPIGPWTDVYSFALVILELLQLKKARGADNVVQALRVSLSPESACPTPEKLGIHVSRSVESVFARATAFKAQERWPDLGAFWSALRDAMLSTPHDLAHTFANDDLPGAALVRAAIDRAAENPTPAPGAPSASPPTLIPETEPLGDVGPRPRQKSQAQTMRLPPVHAALPPDPRRTPPGSPGMTHPTPFGIAVPVGPSSAPQAGPFPHAAPLHRSRVSPEQRPTIVVRKARPKSVLGLVVVMAVLGTVVGLAIVGGFAWYQTNHPAAEPAP